MLIVGTTAWDVFALVVATALGAIFGAIGSSLLIARETVRVNDADARNLDDELAEWLVIADRDLEQRLDRSPPEPVLGDGRTIEERDLSLAPTRTITLYAYRRQLHDKQSELNRLYAREGIEHAIYRKLFRRPRVELDAASKAQPLIDYWMRGTDANQLDWSLEDCLAELESRPNFHRSARSS